MAGIFTKRIWQRYPEKSGVKYFRPNVYRIRISGLESGWIQHILTEMSIGLDLDWIGYGQWWV